MSSGFIFMLFFVCLFAKKANQQRALMRLCWHLAPCCYPPGFSVGSALPRTACACPGSVGGLLSFLLSLLLCGCSAGNGQG